MTTEEATMSARNTPESEAEAEPRRLAGPEKCVDPAADRRGGAALLRRSRLFGNDHDRHCRKGGPLARGDAAPLSLQGGHRPGRGRTPACEAPESVPQGDRPDAARRDARAQGARGVPRARQASDVRGVPRTLDRGAHGSRTARDPEASAGSVRAGVVPDRRRSVPRVARRRRGISTSRSTWSITSWTAWP